MVRHGSGGGDCMLGRKIRYENVLHCYLSLFCRLMRRIGGFEG